MDEKDRNLGERWFEEVWNKRRREAIAEMLAPDCILHEAGESASGPEGFYPFFDRMEASFSNFQITVQDTISQDDKICVRWSCTATHTGYRLGMAPTGKTLAVTGITIMRVADGKIVEAWQNWDMLGLIQQIQGGDSAATYISAPA